MQKNFYYAQLNEDKICVGICDLAGNVNAENMIAINDYDTSLLSKKYSNNSWTEIEQFKYKTINRPTLQDVAQLINDLKADLEIGGII